MYEDRLYEALKEEMLQEITQTDKREGSFVNDIISTSAMKGDLVIHLSSISFLKLL